MRTGHTSCRRGKKVRLKMKNGKMIYGIFWEKIGKWIYLKVDGKIEKYDAGLCFGLVIWKPQKQWEKKK